MNLRTEVNAFIKLADRDSMPILMMRQWSRVKEAARLPEDDRNAIEAEMYDRCASYVKDRVRLFSCMRGCDGLILEMVKELEGKAQRRREQGDGQSTRQRQ